MGSEQSVEIICRVHMYTAQGEQRTEIESRWNGKKSWMRETSYQKLKEFFGDILICSTPPIDIPENVLKMFYEVAQDYDSCDVQVIIIELLLEPTTNTIVGLFAQKMKFSGLDERTVDNLISMELNTIEKQREEIVSFFRQI